MRRFRGGSVHAAVRYGWGTFKMDWALTGPSPWSAGPGASIPRWFMPGIASPDLIYFTRQVRAGGLPANPYLVIGQQSLCDPTRAPAGCHTPVGILARAVAKWKGDGPGAIGGVCRPRRATDRRVGSGLPRFDFGHEPFFRRPTLEAMDENLVRGDLGGGSTPFMQQLFLRPAFSVFRHRTGCTGCTWLRRRPIQVREFTGRAGSMRPGWRSRRFGE